MSVPKAKATRPADTATDDPELEPPLTALEDCLTGLAQALRNDDARAIEQQANELHRALARATAALDRAIDVLLPEPGNHGVYGAAGQAQRRMQSGQMQA